MSPRRYARVATLLAVAGTGFAGYLSATRMLSGSCAFDESCPFFLGQPACYYGFVLFASLLVVSLAALVSGSDSPWPAALNGVVSVGGIAFAARMTAVDAAAGGRHPLLLPSCAWGLVFFAAVAAVSVAALAKRGGRRHAAV